MKTEWARSLLFRNKFMNQKGKLLRRNSVSTKMELKLRMLQRKTRKKEPLPSLNNKQIKRVKR